MFSSEGHHHRHPDDEAIALVLKARGRRTPLLAFNAETNRTRPWGRASWRERLDCRVSYGDDNGYLWTAFEREDH